MYHATRDSDGKVNALYNAPDSTGVIVTEELAPDHPDVVAFQDTTPSPSEARLDSLHDKLGASSLSNTEINEMLRLERGM